MLTWKIVESSKALVIYIYIHIKDLELFKNDRSDFILYEDFSIANKASLYIQVD